VRNRIVAYLMVAAPTHYGGRGFSSQSSDFHALALVVDLLMRRGRRKRKVAAAASAAAAAEMMYPRMNETSRERRTAEARSIE